MRCFQACCSVEHWHINVLRPSIPRNTLTFPWDFEAGNTRPCSFIRGNNRQTDRHTAAETMARRILVKGGEEWRNSCRRKFRKFRAGGEARDEPSDGDFGTGYFRPRLIKFKPSSFLQSSNLPRRLVKFLRYHWIGKYGIREKVRRGGESLILRFKRHCDTRSSGAPVF